VVSDPMVSLEGECTNVEERLLLEREIVGYPSESMSHIE